MKSSTVVSLSIYIFALSLTSGLSRATMAQENELSVKQKVGQILIFGYPGTDLSSDGARLLSKVRPGGLIAFGRHIKNLDQIGRLNSKLQKFARDTGAPPFLLMVDQEGGTVSRIHLAAPLPSALALGSIDNDSLVENYGELTGALLRSLGFQMNLAPVLDLSDPRSKTFIGNRSFGLNPKSVAQTSLLYSKGLAKAGIIPTAKHFPGHGGVNQDSHQTTPRKLATIEELESADLKPFEEFSKIESPTAIMLGHVSLPNADPTSMPAAFSHFVLNDILRDKVKFTGLAITDDVEMSGAAIAGALGERVIKAFEAGNDMIMIAGSTKSQLIAYNSLLEAVNNGRISIERLDRSIERILAAKSNVKPFSYLQTTAHQNAAKLNALGQQVAQLNFNKASLALKELQGFYNSNQSYLILSSDQRFFSAFKQKIPNGTKPFRLTPNSLSQVSKFIRKNPNSIAVYYASGLQTARWLQSIPTEDKSRLIVINTNHSAAIEYQGEFKAVFNINTPAPESGAWLAEFLSFKPFEEAEHQAANEDAQDQLAK